MVPSSLITPLFPSLCSNGVFNISQGIHLGFQKKVGHQSDLFSPPPLICILWFHCLSNWFCICFVTISGVTITHTLVLKVDFPLLNQILNNSFLSICCDGVFNISQETSRCDSKRKSSPPSHVWCDMTTLNPSTYILHWQLIFNASIANFPIVEIDEETTEHNISIETTCLHYRIHVNGIVIPYKGY